LAPEKKLLGQDLGDSGRLGPTHDDCFLETKFFEVADIYHLEACGAQEPIHFPDLARNTVAVPG